MAITVRKYNAQVKDQATGNMIPAGLLSSDSLAAINTATTTAVNTIQAKGTQVIASIPSDYTALDSEVDELKSALQKYNTVDVIAGMIRVPTGSDTVKYAYSDDTLRVWTTAPTTVAVYEGFISRANIPAYLIPGNTYYVPFKAVKTGPNAGKASNLYLLIGFYNSDAVRTQLDTIRNGGRLVTVPSDTTQIALTLTTPKGTDIAETYPDEVTGMEMLTAAAAYDMYQPGFTVTSGANLNDIVIRSGFYYLAPGATYINTPNGISLEAGGLLEVMRLAPHVVFQRLTALSGESERHFRYTNGTSDKAFYSWISE